MSSAPRPLRGLDNTRKRVQKWFSALSFEGQCYTSGLALLTAAAGLPLIKRPGVGFLAQVGALVFAVGLLPLIGRLYEWAWERALGKLTIAALIALATNMAYGFGRQMVADLIGTPSQSGIPTF